MTVYRRTEDDRWVPAEELSASWWVRLELWWRARRRLRNVQR